MFNAGVLERKTEPAIFGLGLRAHDLGLRGLGLRTYLGLIEISVCFFFWESRAPVGDKGLGSSTRRLKPSSRNPKLP